MTQEEKQILLIDLSARLPYGVKYCRDSWNYEWDQEISVVEVLEDIDKDGYINYHKVYKVDDIKPYLRPMSSMTEKEIEECYQLQQDTIHVTFYKYDEGYEKTIDLPYFKSLVDFYNSHHLDYRGLIPMGLALEAPEGVYKTE